MKKSIRIALLTSLAVLLAACSKEAPEAPPVRTVYAVQVSGEGGTRDSANAYSGDIRAAEQAPLSFRVPGSLTERRVDVGDAVRAGQVLAVLDSGDQSAQANAIRAQLAAAQAQLQRVTADQRRYAALAKDQLVSKSMMDAQNAAVAAAQGEVNAIQANLRLATNQARYTQLTAPRSGVIAERMAEAGQVVGAGQPIFTLAADGAREVVFAVPESDISQVRRGMPVQVELWSSPGAVMQGTIAELSPVADPATRTFTARARINPGAVKVELGQSAKVMIPGLEVRGATAALSVPLTALVKSDGAKPSVLVIDPASKTLKQTFVTLGPFGAETVPVTAGLRGGEWIVAAGAHLLSNGVKVQPVDRDNRPVMGAAAK